MSAWEALIQSYPEGTQMGVFFAPKLAKLALLSASAARIAAKAYHAGKQAQERITEFLYPQEEEDIIVMKKSTFAAILVFFAAVAGALAAVYFYLRRRESELDEYEQLLFSEDFSHEENGSVSDEVDAAFAEPGAAEASAEEEQAGAASGPEKENGEAE